MREVAEQQITLKNTGTMPLQYHWQAVMPFRVTPAAHRPLRRSRARENVRHGLRCCDGCMQCCG